MIKRLTFESREAWLSAREGKIGGSDAGCIIGLNPWKTNTELWAEKIKVQPPKDLSDNPLVQYGIQAEPLIRELFKLDFPEYKVDYYENNMIINDEYPDFHYSADGELTERATGRRGLLEIKTSSVMSAAAAEKWKDDHLPQTYYTQILWGFIVTGAEFAILRAHINYPREGELPFAKIKHYKIERQEVKSDMDYLAEEGLKFAECIRTRREPALILPRI